LRFSKAAAYAAPTVVARTTAPPTTNRDLGDLEIAADIPLPPDEGRP
jgi:hypothetical protein